MAKHTLLQAVAHAIKHKTLRTAWIDEMHKTHKRVERDDLEIGDRFYQIGYGHLTWLVTGFREHGEGGRVVITECEEHPESANVEWWTHPDYPQFEFVLARRD